MEILILLVALAVGLYFLFKKNKPSKQKNSWDIPKNYKSSARKSSSSNLVDSSYSQLIQLLYGDKSKAERLIAYELKQGSKTRPSATSAALDRLLRDRQR